LRVAVLDTGYCLRKLEKKNHLFHTIIDVTRSVRFSCKDMSLRDKRFHGHMVLKEFLKNYTGSRPISLYPLIVFDKNAEQKIEYWQRALEWCDKNHIEVIIAAAGLPIKKKEKLPILKNSNTLILLASGREDAFIKKGTQLFPQGHHARPNIYLFGSYHPALYSDDIPLFDNKLLYREHVHFFLSGGKSHEYLRGSSRAVATGAGLALSQCGHLLPSLRKVEDCLDKRQEKIDLQQKRKTFTLTYKNPNLIKLSP
jgi:hypothetical protein